MSFAAAPAPAATPAEPAAVSTPAPGGTPPPSTIYVAPANAAVINGPFGDSSANDTTPALRALPVETSEGGPDASQHRKFYTLTASLRETYDDNVNTTNTNKQSSLETELSPSILVDFPDAYGEFSGRYTFGLTYYETGPHPGNNGNGSAPSGNNGRDAGSIEMSHDLVAQYSHAFSSRFQLALAEEFRYDIQPNIIQSVGTNYQDGAYYTNLLNGTLSAQWTPKFSTTATFSNTVVQYQESSVGNQQNSIEDNGSLSANYAILPKISVSAGTQIDDITYESGDRGYTSYTIFGGGSWQALPSLSFTGRGGASYTETVGDNSAQVTPYAAMSASWILGARSSLSFSYSHEVTPSSQAGANGQLSDRFGANFNYQITPRLSSSLQGTYTLSTVTGGLDVAGAGLASDYEENVYGVGISMAYAYNTNFSFDWGLDFTGVNSNIDNNNYTRDEAHIGVRGTY